MAKNSVSTPLTRLLKPVVNTLIEEAAVMQASARRRFRSDARRA